MSESIENYTESCLQLIEDIIDLQNRAEYARQLRLAQRSPQMPPWLRPIDYDKMEEESGEYHGE